MSNTGYFLVYRKLFDHEIGQNPLAVALWVRLLSDASYEDKDVFWDNKTITIKRGQIITSIDKLAKWLCISRRTTKRLLDALQNVQQINIKTTNKYTVISIKNYDKYQILPNKESMPNKLYSKRPSKGIINEQQNSGISYAQEENNLPNKRPTDGTTNAQQTPTTKEYKEYKEYNTKTDTSPKYLLNVPSNDLAEFTLSFICTDRQVIHKGQELYDYCQSKGRAYKDYKSFLRNALRKDFGDRVVVEQFKPDLPNEVSLEGLEKFRKMKEEILGNH